MFKRPSDPNELAFQIVQEATGQRPPLQTPEAVRAERASKGGHGRARALSASRRSAIARRAAESRWAVGASATREGGSRDEESIE